MKHLNLLIFTLLFTITVKAQDDMPTLSFNVYGGYTFQDRLEYNNAYGYVRDGIQYGGGLEFYIYGGSSIELKYMRLDTEMPLYYRGDQINAEDDKGAINYILVGGNHYFDTGTMLSPYIGAGVGIGIVESPQSGSDSYFAWDMKLGVKIKTGSVVSVNLNAYFQSVSAAVSNGYYDPYYPYYPYYVDYVSTYQFGLGAVLCFDFY